MPNETESKTEEPGMWDSFVSSLSETQVSHLHQLLLGKTKIGESVKTENVPEKSQEENVSKDVPKIIKEPEYKHEPQLQKCKKPGCPVGGKPMGASYAAAELIKRNHRSKLKRLFPDDKDGEEESLKVMPDSSAKVMPDNTAKVTPDDTAKVTPEKEKKKRKSSKPNKIDINKKSDESEDDSFEKPKL